jgi:hypothetical protein
LFGINESQRARLVDWNEELLRLRVKRSDDSLEMPMSNREARRTTAFPPSTRASGVLQRKCDCGNHTIGGGACSACSKQREPTLQRSAISHEPANSRDSAVPPVVHEVLRSSGQPLDATTRAFFEPRFGHNFSGVRVHSYPKAAESADAVNALAYTVGRDIVFGAHQYAPTTGQGRRLLAHELTHTLQQSSSPAASLMNALRIGPADDVHEQEAETLAARIVESGEGGPAPLPNFASTPSLQRAPKEKAPTKPTAPAQPTKAKCVEQMATTSEFSRGNDDLRECDYETARISVSLWWNPCACSAKAPKAPLRLKYHVVMGGKNEIEASEEVAGRGKDEKTGKPVTLPGIGLRETGAKGKGPVQPLKHTKKPPAGDPGDFLDADYTPPQVVACTDGSANGSVDVGTSETITWSITTDGAQKVKAAAIGLVEHTPTNPPRFPTPTRDLAKEKPYPVFPGDPRRTGCTCDATNGACMNQKGDDFCIPNAPAAKVGP